MWMTFWRNARVRVLALYVVLTALFFWPLIAHPFRMIPDDYDGLFITYTMNWVGQSLTHQPRNIFQEPLFAPYPLVLTFSDPFVTAAVIGEPFFLLTHQPIIFFTVNFLIAAVTTAFFCFLLVDELTQNSRLSFLAGAVCSFSVTHLHYLGHLHVFMMQFIPLGLWAWVKYTRERHDAFLLLFVLSFVAQTLNSPFAGYLFLLCCGMFLFDEKTWQTLRQSWKKVGVLFCIFGILPVGALYLPYFASANLYHSYRSIREAAHFSLSVNELIASNRVSTALLVVGLFSAYHARKKWLHVKKHLIKNRLLTGCLCVCFVSVFLTLGPVLKWRDETVKIFHNIPIPLPYSVLYVVIPGFKAFRTPSRWIVATLMSVVVGLSLYWHEYWRKNILPKWVVILILLAMWIEAQQFLVFYAVPSLQEYPSAYLWLNRQQATSVVHLPTYVYDMPDGKIEAYRMLYSLATGGEETVAYPSANQTRSAPFRLTMYNGYSGFTPQERLDEMNFLHDHPLSNEAQARLRAQQIALSVFHLDELSANDRILARELTPRALYVDTNTLVLRTANWQPICLKKKGESTTGER
jgi:hypothetical protein